MRAIRHIVTHARRVGINHLTLFAFSSENWKRSNDEVSMIMALLERYLLRECRTLEKQSVKLKIIGDTKRLSFSLRRAIALAEDRTDAGSAMHLTLAISYAGQDEIVEAASAIAAECCAGTLRPAAITRDLFASFLQLPTLPQVDLLIRTGGECRLSNFLLWQVAYAELVFIATFWPDFTAEDLDRCLSEFAGRQRRFGATE